MQSGRAFTTLLTAVLLCSSAAYAETEQTGTLTYPPAYFAEARPNTAYDMIQRLPGFTFDDGTSARGFAGTAGNVLIDGQRPTAKTDDLQSILNRISASDVERIDVIRGSAPGIDMHGQTVVANVVRKKSDSTQIVADVSNNFFPDGHMVPGASLQITHRTGQSTYEGSVSLVRNFNDSVGVGFYDVTDVATGDVQHSEVHTTGMGLGWQATGAAEIPLLGGRFKANFTYQDSPWRALNTYFSPSGDWSILDSSGSKSGELGLHWSGVFGNEEIETLVLQRFGRNTDINTYEAAASNQYFASKNRTGESIARAILRYKPDSDLTIEGGVEGVYNFLDGSSTYIVDDVPVPLPSANARVEEKRGEAFGQATWKFSPDWVLEAGARFEYSIIGETGYTTKSRSLFFPKPRAVLTWTPTKNMQVRLRYERVVGQLDFGNFVASSDLAASGVNAGNPDLEPDRHTQYAASFEYDFWGKGALVVTFLHDEISGVVDYIPVIGSSGVFDAPGNIGNGRINQIDTKLTLPLDKMGLTNGLLKIVNNWTFSRVRDPVTGRMRGISGKRAQDIEVTLSQDIESLKSTWSIFFFNCWDEYSYRLTEERHSYVVPPYFELSWVYKPTPAWSLEFDILNPARFSYDDTHVRYSGPRNSSTPYEISEFKVKSQPRIYIEIRKTF
jgi:outer membrane receptor protein involved in Fe transport